jgi:hypothetical protein
MANKQVFERWTKAVENHGMISTFNAKPIDARNPCASSKFLVNTKLMPKGTICALHWFKLDSYITS